MIEAFQTLDDGTLVDYAIDDQQRLSIRAGRTLTPAERPILLLLSPADALALIRIVIDLYKATPVDLVLQEALEMHRRGATHDCGEWIRNGKCLLCEKVVDP